MGGYGSGRHSGILPLSLNDLPTFDIDRFVRTHGSRELNYVVHRLSFGGTVAIKKTASAIHFSYFAGPHQQKRRCTKSSHTLEHVACSKGGTRSHIVCGHTAPHGPCRHRCRVLYFKDGQTMCRNSCGLPYRTQQGMCAAAHARLNNLRAKLGCAPGAGPLIPPRPMYMRTTTYFRLCNEIIVSFAVVTSQEGAVQQRLLHLLSSCKTPASVRQLDRKTEDTE